MNRVFRRVSTLASIFSAILLTSPVAAQTGGKARRPVASTPPAATTPQPTRTPTSTQQLAEPWHTLDGSDWLLLKDRLDDAHDEADMASQDVSRNLNTMFLDLDSDSFAPMASLNLDLAPMVASAIPGVDLDFAPETSWSLFDSPRAPWAASDPADSLYTRARQALNAGDYRKAAQLFAQITQKYPNSQYRSDATYWRAFALYRIGGTADLHEALSALDAANMARNSAADANTAAESATNAYREKMSTALAAANGARAAAEADRTSAELRAAGVLARQNVIVINRSNDAAILAMRIRSALAARGDAAAAAQIASAAAAGTSKCDEEDADLRVEALNALVQMDPRNAEPAITKVLARRDSCSVPLRRGAVALAARGDDTVNSALLISTARNDPSIEVQAEAIRALGRSPDATTTTALANIVNSSKNPALQRIAVRSLAAQETPAARNALKGFMSRTDLPSDVRITALHYAGKTDLTVSDLSSAYDAASDRSTRQEIVSLLGQRKEPEAADKLVSIARTSTDPALRRRAIDALASRKDPRATKLLMDILNK